MKTSAFYIVIYDISDNKERRWVNKILIGFGFRVQKSVFECRLDRKYYNELKQKIDNLDIKTGFVKIYKKERLRKDDIIGTREHEDVDSKNAYIF